MPAHQLYRLTPERWAWVFPETKEKMKERKHNTKQPCPRVGRHRQLTPCEETEGSTVRIA